MKKRIFALLIIAALAAFSFVGCSDETGETDAANETDADLEYAPDYIIINGQYISTAEVQLELDGLQITNADFEQLRYMISLQSLIIFPSTPEHGSIRNISALSGLENLNELELIRLQLYDSDIESLKHIVNLTHLDLSGNQISDISVLSELTNLASLLLNSNQISDVNALSELTNLERLYFLNNQISNVEALAGLSNLRELSLVGNQISDVSALAGLSNLEILWLQGNPLSDERIADLRAALPNTHVIADDSLS